MVRYMKVVLVTVGYAQLAVNSSTKHLRNSSKTTDWKTIAWRGGGGNLTMGEASLYN